MNIHIDRNGESLGPFNLEDAREKLISGELLENDMAWHDGVTDWVPLPSLINPPDFKQGK